MVFVLVAVCVFYYGMKERERAGRESDRSMQGLQTEPARQETNEAGAEKLEAAETEPEPKLETASEMEETPSSDVLASLEKAGKDTLYRVELYDTYSGELTVEEKPLPAEFIGLDRSEIEGYWEDYMGDIPLSEFEKGLLSCELVGFSEECVTVRKTYDSSEMKYQFYVVIENGCVTVYYSDRKTPYEHTDIFEEALPEDEVDKLRKGVYVEGEEELYGMLESLTS